MKICSCVWKNIGLVVLLLGVVLLFNYLQGIRENAESPVSPSQPIPEKVYREPSIKIPFITKDKQPIPNEELPVPKKEVDKTITITLPDKKIDLVIDKKGEVYPTKTVPSEVKISVTTWKPKLFEFGWKFGYSGVFDGQVTYHCLSLDALRLGRFSFGSEIGVGGNVNKLLIGLSGKYQILEITQTGKISVVGGWNFIGNRAYVGVNIKW